MLLVAWACARSLPEPESEAAQLYVKYCSGSGCHGPIPPGGSNAKYWDIQYGRMLEVMEKSGIALPPPREDAMIRDYLARHALP